MPSDPHNSDKTAPRAQLPTLSTKSILPTTSIVQQVCDYGLQNFIQIMIVESNKLKELAETQSIPMSVAAAKCIVEYTKMLMLAKRLAALEGQEANLNDVSSERLREVASEIFDISPKTNSKLLEPDKNPLKVADKV